MKTKDFATVFILYLAVYLWLKAINEISFKSIEYFFNINELLILLIVTSISYQFLNKMRKGNDFFVTGHLKIKKSKFFYSLISFIGSLAIAAVVHLKISAWVNGFHLVTIAVFVLSYTSLYYSLSED